MSIAYGRMVVCAALIATGLSAAALAQERFLSAGEVRELIFDSEIRGGGEGTPRYIECVNAMGESYYRVEGRPPDAGMVAVGPDGQVCFAYSSEGFDNPACWRVRRDDNHYILSTSDGGEEHVATIRRGRAGACFANGDPFRAI